MGSISDVLGPLVGSANGEGSKLVNALITLSGGTPATK